MQGRTLGIGCLRGELNEDRLLSQKLYLTESNSGEHLAPPLSLYPSNYADP